MRDDDPPTPDADTPSRLHRTLGRLRSFRSRSPFHLGTLKPTGSTKSSASDSETTSRTDDRMRKKNKKTKQDAASSASGTSKSTEDSPVVEKKKKEGAGAFVRRLGSIGRRRADEIASANSSQSSSVRVMDDPSEPCALEVEPNVASSKSSDPAVPDVAVVHPISTKPFNKSTWRRKSHTLPEMEKPIEEPSPESALKRRIAFVAQASACLSEDVGDEEGMPAVGSLHEAVALARVRLSAPQRSASPSPLSRDVDTEEEVYDDAMPPYGDLIEPEDKTDNEPSTSSVSGFGVCGRGIARARAERSQWFGVLRAMRARYDLRSGGG